MNFVKYEVNTTYFRVRTSVLQTFTLDKPSLDESQVQENLLFCLKMNIVNKVTCRDENLIFKRG